MKITKKERYVLAHLKELKMCEPRTLYVTQKWMLHNEDVSKIVDWLYAKGFVVFTDDIARLALSDDFIEKVLT